LCESMTGTRSTGFMKRSNKTIRGELETFMLLQESFLYIHCGVFVALPGDIIHTGRFCLGMKFRALCRVLKRKTKRDISKISIFIMCFVVLSSMSPSILGDFPEKGLGQLFL